MQRRARGPASGALSRKQHRRDTAKIEKRGEAIPVGALYLVAIFSVLIGSISANARDGDARPYRIFHPDIAPWGDSASHDGFIVRIVETAFDRAGLSYEVVYAPWKREQAAVQQLQFAFMAPLTRLESREALYQWIAPVNISYLELVTNNPGLAALRIEDLLDFPAAARVESPAEFTLRKLGFRSITLVEDEEVAARLLRAGRVTLWMQRGLPGRWAYRTSGGSTGQLFKIKRWTTPQQYLVASPGVPLDVVEKLRDILTAMRDSGEMDRIKQSFFDEELPCELMVGCSHIRNKPRVRHP